MSTDEAACVPREQLRKEFESANSDRAWFVQGGTVEDDTPEGFVYGDFTTDMCWTCYFEARNVRATPAREAALREELARLKEVTCFKDAVACVFDNLKFAAANTRSKEWDDQLEELAEDVIEFAPEYKKQWKDIGSLSQRLTAAEQRNADLVELLRESMPHLDNAASAFKAVKPIRDKIRTALKPTESGASE